MIPAVNDQATLPLPPPPEGVAIADADFVNGIYDGDGISGFLDILSSADPDFADWIVPGAGLVSFLYYYDPDTSNFLDGNPISYIGTALSQLLTGEFTYIIEFHLPVGEFADLLRISDATDTSSPAKRLAIEAPEGNYFLAFDRFDGSPSIERDLTMDSDVPDSLTTGIHVVALSRTDDRISVSIDGGAVKTNSDPQHSFSEGPLTNAWLGGGPDSPFGQIIVGRIQVLSIQDDAALPGLSVVTVMTKPANDDFADAEVLTTGITAYGRTFAASKETGEPNHAGFTVKNSVWYEWTAPTSDDYTVDLTGSDDRGTWGFSLGIYTGSAVGSLSLVANSSSWPEWPAPPIVNFTAVMGTVYHFAVAGQGGGEGKVQIKVDLTS